MHVGRRSRAGTCGGYGSRGREGGEAAASGEQQDGGDGEQQHGGGAGGRTGWGAICLERKTWVRIERRGEG